MEIVSYLLRFDYRYDAAGEPFPMLQPKISSPRDPERAVEVDAFLDSGAQRSLFQGWIATVLGFDLLAGDSIRYVSTIGRGTEARLHTIRLSHPDLGDFQLQVGFSTAEISRNLLGRDFFNLVQIGFRERHWAFYITPTP